MCDVASHKRWSGSFSLHTTYSAWSNHHHHPFTIPAVPRISPQQITPSPFPTASGRYSQGTPRHGSIWNGGQHTLHPISRSIPLSLEPDWLAGEGSYSPPLTAIPITDVTRSIVHASSRSGPCLYCIDAHAFPPAINVRRVRSEGSMPPCHAPWRGSAAGAGCFSVGYCECAEDS